MEYFLYTWNKSSGDEKWQKILVLGYLGQLLWLIYIAPFIGACLGIDILGKFSTENFSFFGDCCVMSPEIANYYFVAVMLSIVFVKICFVVTDISHNYKNNKIYIGKGMWIDN